MRKDREPSTTCPNCAMTSYHPMDIKKKWCANCNGYYIDILFKEFQRICRNFDRASQELSRTGYFRPFKIRRLFKDMRQANLEMEWLGNKFKMGAIT